MFLSTSNNYFALNFPHTIQFIHDLAPMHFPQYYKLNARLLYASTSKMALAQALHIVTISESVKAELIALNPKAKDKISVINAFINEKILTEQKKYPEITSNTNYILSISAFDPKKNTELSIKVFAELIKNLKFRDYKYYIIGKKEWHYKEILDLITKLGVEKSVIVLGYVEDCYIADIVSRSKCMLLLSMYEGFGMTPLESLYFNVPVVVSNIPVFREVLSDMANYVDCEDDDCIQTAALTLMKAIDRGKVDTKDKVIKMYNANKSAQKLLEIINLY
jgi:glycosyltransferase involved in cell wall biosynthesis